MDPEVHERITARRAELDELEEQLVKQLSEVRDERDELAVAVLHEAAGVAAVGPDQGQQVVCVGDGLEPDGTPTPPWRSAI
ncbi:hypothetical protein ACFU53_44055 [Streptomyces sp. NPDC057474]|uniref:hypothetical protein n=1 Tax=Streptomyces sp. NPDC057474 TaxID=3346144 RepID=UPI0036ABA01D